MDHRCILRDSRSGAFRGAGDAIIHYGLLGALRAAGIFLTGAFEFAISIALVTRPFRAWAGIAMAMYAVCVLARQLQACRGWNRFAVYLQ